VSSIIDDVAQVSHIMTTFTLPMVLGYPPTSITISQASITVGRRCFFASSVLCPIFKLVLNEGLAPMVIC
jgi:hypothetical protein